MQVLVLHQVGGADLPGSGCHGRADTYANLHAAVTVHDVVGATSFDRVVAATTDENVAVTPHVATEWALTGCRCCGDRRRGSGQCRNQRVESGDPVEASLIDGVASGESGSPNGCRC